MAYVIHHETKKQSGLGFDHRWGRRVARGRRRGGSRGSSRLLRSHRHVLFVGGAQRLSQPVLVVEVAALALRALHLRLRHLLRQTCRVRPWFCQAGTSAIPCGIKSTVRFAFKNNETHPRKPVVSVWRAVAHSLVCRVLFWLCSRPPLCDLRETPAFDQCACIRALLWTGNWSCDPFQSKSWWVKQKSTHWTVALSPVRRQSRVIVRMVAVCRTPPQWIMAWYLGEIVVGWCRTSTSASNSQQHLGSSCVEIITIPGKNCVIFGNCQQGNRPFLMVERLIFLRANEAVWPPATLATGMRLRWIDFTGTCMNRPHPSGPNCKVSFNLIKPLVQVPMQQTEPCYMRTGFRIHWTDRKPRCPRPAPHTCRQFETRPVRTGRTWSAASAGSGTSSTDPCFRRWRWRPGRPGRCAPRRNWRLTRAHARHWWPGWAACGSRATWAACAARASSRPARCAGTCRSWWPRRTRARWGPAPGPGAPWSCRSRPRWRPPSACSSRARGPSCRRWWFSGSARGRPGRWMWQPFQKALFLKWISTV